MKVNIKSYIKYEKLKIMTITSYNEVTKAGNKPGKIQN